MKRKLDENDQPVPSTVPETSQDDKKSNIAAPETSFADLGLDPRLLQAVARQSYKKPTAIQAKAIPLILDGSDVLAKSKTGSGKTAAYLLPILQSILKRKASAPTISQTTALILTPTRELADQVAKSIETLSTFCAKEVQAVKLSDKLSESVQHSLLSTSPDIVVATPTRAWNSIKNSSLSLEHLTHICLDEADIVLSHGYDEDLQNIASSIPKGSQNILVSATLTTEVDTLKGLFCRNPTVLDLEEPDSEGEGVSQYVVECGEEEKFLLIYVMIKLKLVKGKSLIFVNDVDRCYRLKLFFEQFGIRSCCLNPDLPINSRISIVESFNKNVYDIIIASDEIEVLGTEGLPNESDEDNDKEKETITEGRSDSTTGNSKKQSQTRSKKKRKSDKEFGVSRGIDFANVAMVINFDLPVSSKSYTHRIGRTARAGKTGTALSFVVPKSQFRKHLPTSIETAEHDEKILARIIKKQNKLGKEVKPWNFDMKQVEAFRYRLNDALRAVTKVAIREARLRELRTELVNSEKLKRHFEENPDELRHLRHDGELRSARTQPHLKHVPEYLLPAEGKKALTANDIGYVPLRKIRDGKGRRGKVFKGRGKKAQGRKADPLRSFKARSKTK
ncbi:DEAD-domain-containing protein [Xylariomycetidae sp. FL2044]|nr:DEAD-domain-containing protein [Xylariomycetidae sp. FL2044]